MWPSSSARVAHAAPSKNELPTPSPALTLSTNQIAHLSPDAGSARLLTEHVRLATSPPTPPRPPTTTMDDAKKHSKKIVHCIVFVYVQTNMSKDLHSARVLRKRSPCEHGQLKLPSGNMDVISTLVNDSNFNTPHFQDFTTPFPNPTPIDIPLTISPLGFKPYDSNTIFPGSSNYTNSTFSSDYTNSTIGSFDDTKAGFISDVVTYIVICIGLPLTLVAIYALYSVVRSDHVVPIYVINLLVSDLIQLCCMICDVVHPYRPMIYVVYVSVYNYSLMTSVGFMVCIALERYLLIVFPLWYHCRRTIRSTVVICAVAWVLPSLYLFTLFFADNFTVPQIIAFVFLLLPLPLLLFFCCASLKALSASVSILPEEKQRIVGTLVLVLLIYMLLFLPNVILIMVVRYTKDQLLTNTLAYVSSVFLKLNPLVDLVLYIFMKKGVLDKILASMRCCRVEDRDLRSLENNDVN
ncbi:mas-related G-protein coupled receptor member H-like [Etheostoma cragini]|uniref:mas-related G-protein coupled receptor member H-like n=1 Tax=Etheostoma cragini TaxID=417921 RepID=UPI00155F182C|nr:mas-related G-protein coupled receptor member H-like [Etheostoma cragini]